MTTHWRQLGWKAALGVLLFACANVIVYWSSGFFVRSQHYHADVAAALGRPDLSVVLLGDSHVEKIPNKLLARSVQNAAAGGDGYRECYAKLRYLLSASVPVRTLILTTDYHMFGTGRVHSSNRSFVNRYFLATGMRNAYDKGALSATLNLVPLFNDDFVQYLKNDVRVRLRGNARAGSGDSTAWQELSEDVRLKRARATGQGDHLGVGREEEPFTWLQKILDLAKQHDISVVPVRFPVSEAYFQAAPIEARQVVDAALVRMGVPSAIELTNAFQDAMYFHDEDHVNERGAALVVCLLESRTGLRLGNDEVHDNCRGNGEGSLVKAEQGRSDVHSAEHQ